MALNPKFIIDLKGKQFVLFAGLLELAHESGLIAMEHEVMPELSNPAEQFWVVRSIGRFRSADGEAIWTAHGDACPSNSQMKGAYLRHAETRAAARMLRMATNVGMTAFEEMGGDMAAEPPRERVQERARPAAPPRPEIASQAVFCTVDGCGVELTAKEIQASEFRLWEPICSVHGRERVRLEKEGEGSALKAGM